MAEPSESNVQYGAYHQTSSPTPAEREQQALQKAADRGKQTTGPVSEQARLAALEKRVGSQEAMLKRVHGKNGITVNWPVISFTGKAGGSVDTADYRVIPTHMSFSGQVVLVGNVVEYVTAV